MSRTVPWMLAFALVACGDDSTEDAAPDAAADVDSGTFRNDAGVECCIASPMPSCGMSWGGAKRHLGFCFMAIDGMPAPNDPAWRLVDDQYGCPTWTSRGAKGACCGHSRDAGLDVMCYPDPPIPLPE